jgi:hypothetical protein
MRVAAVFMVGLVIGTGSVVACGSSSGGSANGPNTAGSNSGGTSADAGGQDNPAGAANAGTSAGGATADAGGEDTPGGASNGGATSDAGDDPATDSGGGGDPQYGTPDVSDGMWDCSGESSMSCSCAHFPGVDPIDGVPTECLNAWSCCYAALGRVPATVDWRCVCENKSESECTDTIDELNEDSSPYS